MEKKLRKAKQVQKAKRIEMSKGVNPLSLENFWLNKPKFEEAERVFYEAKYVSAYYVTSL